MIFLPRDGGRPDDARDCESAGDGRPLAEEPLDRAGDPRTMAGGCFFTTAGDCLRGLGAAALGVLGFKRSCRTGAEGGIVTDNAAGGCEVVGDGSEGAASCIGLDLMVPVKLSLTDEPCRRFASGEAERISSEGRFRFRSILGAKGFVRKFLEWNSRSFPLPRCSARQ